MNRNSQKQVFKGGWEQLQHGHHTVNITTLAQTRESFFMKPDGSTVFTIEGGGGIVTANTLDSFWDIASIGAILSTFDTSVDITDAFGLCFRDDGTRMYLVSFLSLGAIFQYELPIPWDLSSIVDTPVSLSLSFVSGTALQCVFSTDGDFLFITNGDSITRVPLVTNWDVTSFVPSTDSNFNPTLSVLSAMFKTQGDMMYLGDSASMNVVEFSLSTIWDITTATPTGNEFTFTDDDTLDLSIRTNGLEFFASNFINKTITKFHLEVAWDISSASFFPNISPAPTTFPASITWKPDGLKYFIINAINPDVMEEFGVPVPFNTDGAVSNGTFIVNPPESNPRGMYWILDGTRAWIIGTGTDRIHQFNVATPWDITTMSDPGISALPGGTAGAPQGMSFGDNGFRVYIVDAGDDIMEYTMTTAYDITTMNLTPVNTIDIDPNTPNPRDLVFKPDGSMVFIISSTNRNVTRYTLPTPWSLAGLTFVDSLDLIINGEIGQQGLFIRQDDGKKLFTTGTTNTTINTFDLNLDFNNSIITTLGDEITTEAGENIVYV